MNQAHQPQRTSQATRQSLLDQINALAKVKGVNPSMIRKQYVFALLYRRIFYERSTSWLVLGGNALVLRSISGRFTRDVDLSREGDWIDASSILKELRGLVARDMDDGFDFELTRIDTRANADRYGYGTQSARVYARALIANKEFEPFTIDVSQRRHVTGPVEFIVPSPIIEHPSLQELPGVPVVPIANHLVDKVCAMYERHHGGKPSTRYRDLADIVHIVASLGFSAESLAELLRHEQRRRRIKLPQALTSPGDQWSAAFPKAARDFEDYPPEFHSLDAALKHAGGCLSPILSGEIRHGRWDPNSHAWTPPRS
ncbi:nucleotidyl transferase AbiEii/AbiGii toxin family protein [Micrococcales bacterium 31B]|nr:nucleotidyl transferase AbiEii/AbiGii toxin family protein [Micrococcales bacterium 31B]